ncbi:hypothetical protein [Gelidibacter maritimus]|uniref:NlpE C-terminal OB domain-containing protein n=1 Tax=Gelidibacter maritimus TaxID=2761487 RepID=A0A7W2M318_9FLAO|nr:hypothetical protein [Gelidibacter maritimus]MBA6151778.1 hypothetical protein [Gelidibacter maritimus]
MKRTIFLVFTLMAFVGCKNDSKSTVGNIEDQDQLKVRELTGNFIYYDNAGVLQTESELFGVIEDENAKELIERATPLKNQPTDEVKVTLKVKVIKKQKHEEGWDNRVEIIDIISVSEVAEKNNNVIKIRAQE